MPSYYDQTIPCMLKFCSNLLRILRKADRFAADNNMPQDQILNATLAPDMKPLKYQIQSISTSSAGFCPNLAGHTPVTFTNDETSLAELQARLLSTIEMLIFVERAVIDAQPEKEIILETSSAKVKIPTVQRYISEWVLPSFHFHAATAYGILRNVGVPLGGMDYFEGVFVPA